MSPGAPHGKLTPLYLQSKKWNHSIDMCQFTSPIFLPAPYGVAVRATEDRQEIVHQRRHPGLPILKSTEFRINITLRQSSLIFLWMNSKESCSWSYLLLQWCVTTQKTEKSEANRLKRFTKPFLEFSTLLQLSKLLDYFYFFKKIHRNAAIMNTQLGVRVDNEGLK